MRHSELLCVMVLCITCMVLVGTVTAVDQITLPISMILLGLILFSITIISYYFRLRINFSKQELISNSKYDQFSQSLINISPDAIVVFDNNMRVLNFNASAEKLFGYKSDEIIDRSIINTLISIDGEARFTDFINSCKNEVTILSHPFHQPLFSKHGDEILTAALLVVTGDADNVQYILNFQDKSSLVEAEDRLHFATYNDELTGLPNRHIAMQHIHQGIEDAKRNSRNLIVMNIGLDRFKHINDSLGHDSGDVLLVRIAARLKEGIRRGDLVSRISGDQFVVTLTDVDKKTNIDRLIRNFIDDFSQPFYISEHTLHVSVSIGIACYPDDTTSVDGLLRDCESAMFQAKQRGGTNFRYYSQDMREKSKERLYLENELRRAISRHELDVFYQPQVNLRTGKIVGVEALARWTHPKLGMVSPVQFIPVAEEIGLISEIGQWVMKRACADMTLMQKDRKEALRLSINLSAHQFMDDNLVQKIANVLNETGFPPENLELEITESLFMEDVDNVAETLNILSGQGIRVSMDDFGTGYSSLSYLKRFPINTIKVDRSFVKDIISDEDDALIVRATIQMAHSLSLDIVAEGVETEEQLRFLINQKCDKIQGFYFSRPLSFSALVSLMAENRQIELNTDKICLISGHKEQRAIVPNTIFVN
ncbi:MAG: EAL domain-containing protein [Gammaproteobacteria bacterium]|nr:EAL domain-containing protein [Gammaproteobacteria bacterium]